MLYKYRTLDNFRFFVDIVMKQRLFAPVKVKEVIAGAKMSNQDYGFIKELIRKLDDTIVVRRAEDMSHIGYY